MTKIGLTMEDFRLILDGPLNVELNDRLARNAGHLVKIEHGDFGTRVRDCFGNENVLELGKVVVWRLTH